MALTPGASLGAYRIVSSEGVGGMGEVYRAQDLRLGREVALKVLPAAFAQDPERRNRLEREARLLAQLNHPNIATVHGFQEVENHSFLEMELVTGDTLSTLFACRPMPLREALPIFRQIAMALEAAHERGIVHRDLKPSNVKVTADGRVKVLDFGLAKVLGSDSGSSPHLVETHFELSNTAPGVIVGTAAYMSPEQARGAPVDRRTDIWAFGVVMYEGLAGCPPFKADTFPDTLVKVLSEEPDWSALKETPPIILRLLQRCLRKDLQSRLRDIADARLEIEDVINESQLGRASVSMALPAAGSLAPLPLLSPSSSGTSLSSLSFRGVPARALLAGAGLATLLVGGVAGWIVSRAAVPSVLPAPPAAVVRVSVPLVSGQRIVRDLAAPLAVSPDGSAIAYAAADRGSRTRLYLRRLGQFAPVLLAGTDGASAPFFSIDGRWIGFHADGAIQKVALAGGAPLRIADTPALWSASWGADEAIVFATALPGDGIWKVSAAGGQPERLTTPDVSKRELRHAAPQLLPDGKRVLFSVLHEDGWRAALVALDSKVVTPLSGRLGGPAHYVQGGRLVFAQDGGLVAVRFDAERGELGTAPVPMLERVETGRLGTAYFAVARSGVLAYLPADADRPQRSLIFVDREGRTTPASEVAGDYAYPRFARDGRRLAVTIGAGNGSDVWVYDLQRATRARITTGGMSTRPIWAADGRRIAFEWKGPAVWSLYAKAADGSGREESLVDTSPGPRAAGWADPLAGVLPGSVPSLSGAHVQSPSSWASAGPLAFVEHKPSGERDIWVVRPAESPVPFLISPFDESVPEFSPDGHLLAYVSDESGQAEVYVQPYPGPGAKWLVSVGGGADPVWSPDGRELFYRRGDSVMHVPIRLAPSFETGAPREIFNMNDVVPGDARNYDVSPDGRRFVMVHGGRAAAPGTFNLVLHWLTELDTRTSDQPQGAAPR